MVIAQHGRRFSFDQGPPDRAGFGVADGEPHHFGRRSVQEAQRTIKEWRLSSPGSPPRPQLSRST